MVTGSLLMGKVPGSVVSFAAWGAPDELGFFEFASPEGPAGEHAVNTIAIMINIANSLKLNFCFIKLPPVI